jgi:hypothetical protein
MVLSPFDDAIAGRSPAKVVGLISRGGREDDGLAAEVRKRAPDPWGCTPAVAPRSTAATVVSLSVWVKVYLN